MPRHNNTRAGRRHSDAAEDLARGLGWFSIALGVAEVAAPRMLARNLGMRGSETLIQAYGLREIAAGVGILASRDPTPWIWGRVAGDALDIATLFAGMTDNNHKRENVALALTAVAGVTALDIYCAQALSADQGDQQVFDYSNRSGLPRAPEQMRGLASAEESDAFSHLSTSRSTSGSADI